MCSDPVGSKQKLRGPDPAIITYLYRLDQGFGTRKSVYSTNIIRDTENLLSTATTSSRYVQLACNTSHTEGLWFCFTAYVWKIKKSQAMCSCYSGFWAADSATAQNIWGVKTNGLIQSVEKNWDDIWFLNPKHALVLGLKQMLWVPGRIPRNHPTPSTHDSWPGTLLLCLPAPCTWQVSKRGCRSTAFTPAALNQWLDRSWEMSTL